MTIASAGALVLVVDDDEDLRETLCMALEDEGYSVLQASDGVSALELLRAHASALIVLLDWRMPSMDGIQILEAIAADPALARRHADPALARRHAYILMTAAARIPDSYADVLPDGCTTLALIKPFNLEYMFMLIEQAAERLSAAADNTVAP